MCGITGIMAFNEIGRMHMIQLANSTRALEKRGPDHQGMMVDDLVGLGHRRLSILDTSYNGSQPMEDPSGRYTIVFNGEIYNYRELREELIQEGHDFNSGTDTEVLLRLFIKNGKACLDQLDGFFAFAIYDKEEQSVFIARDRFGIKPLFYFHDEDKCLFASDLKSLQEYNFKRELDVDSLHQYLQYNYIPAPNSIYKGVKKLEPGQYAVLTNKSFAISTYYDLKEKAKGNKEVSFNEAKENVKELLTSSVQKRLIADVPLGSFLSGGVDSSVVSAIASKYQANLETYSVGFADNEFFDETVYANKVAEKHGTRHTVFSLSNSEIFNSVREVMDSFDEPFADSSAIPMYMLSKQTALTKKVALSGDGADEIFGGYNKYRADYKARNPRLQEQVIKAFQPIWSRLPKSRNSKFSNLARQLDKFGGGMQLTSEERYAGWCKLLSEGQAFNLLSDKTQEEVLDSGSREGKILEQLGKIDDLNDVLFSDISLVLQNDMLKKVDQMSMANGLEVRVPFLDHKVVEYAMQLPESYKVNHNESKKVLKAAFKDILPSAVVGRPKKGFELPLLDCLRTELKPMIEHEYLSDSFIVEQGVFNLKAIQSLRQKILSNNPGDVHATVWALLVFQNWWKKNLA